MGAAFEGSLRLVGSKDSMSAVVSLDAGEMTITSGGHQIGQWELEELEVTRQPDGFRIRVEGEELAVAIRDPAAFAAAVGIADKPKRRRRKRLPKARKAQPKAAKVQPKAANAQPKATKVQPKATKVGRESSEAVRRHASPDGGEAIGSSLGARFRSLPLLARIGIVALPFVVAFGIVAPFTLAAILVLAGMLALIVGGFALSDDPTVYMLDARIPEWALPVGGISLVVIGVLLMVVT